jgi:CheY-like chemotaxis protein
VTVARGGREAGVLRVIVLADDLIWATRLVGQLRTLGVDPVRVGSADAFASALADPALAASALAAPAPAGPEGVRPTHAVVDLTARSYDGLAAVRLAATAGLPVLCVGQHDDHAQRRAALAAGAERVFAYRKLFEDGHATLAAWLGVPAPAAGSLSVPPSPAVPAR